MIMSFRMRYIPTIYFKKYKSKCKSSDDVIIFKPKLLKNLNINMYIPKQLSQYHVFFWQPTIEDTIIQDEFILSEKNEWKLINLQYKGNIFIVYAIIFHESNDDNIGAIRPFRRYLLPSFNDLFQFNSASYDAKRIVGITGDLGLINGRNPFDLI